MSRKYQQESFVMPSQFRPSSANVTTKIYEVKCNAGEEIDAMFLSYFSASFRLGLPLIHPLKPHHPPSTCHPQAPSSPFTTRCHVALSLTCTWSPDHYSWPHVHSLQLVSTRYSMQSGQSALSQLCQPASQRISDISRPIVHLNTLASTR